LERAADHSGAAIDRVRVRIGGVIQYSYRAVAPNVPGVKDNPQTLERTRSMLKVLQRRMAASLSRYERSGVLSDREIRLLDLYRKGTSLRAFGRAEGISAPRVSELIEGLRWRAFLFWSWWQHKNRARKRRLVVVPVPPRRERESS
jgi:DNA-binding CsgD family transcriptional regulator